MGPDSFYSLAFGFWQRLTDEHVELPGGIALANRRAPLLLSNAVWYPRASGLDSVASWYLERGIAPALIVTALMDEGLESCLQGSSFRFERSFRLGRLEPSTAATPESVVEQVSWAQGRALGELLAAEHGLPELGVLLGQTLGRAMQGSPEILAFLAYGKEALGAMVVFDRPGSLVAMMLGGERPALERRLVAEAAERDSSALVLEPLPEGVRLRDERTLERWGIR